MVRFNQYFWASKKTKMKGREKGRKEEEGREKRKGRKGRKEGSEEAGR